MTKPHETGTDHPLPFSRLSGSDFETLCFWLAKREGFSNLEHSGAGGSDHGKDLIANKGTRRVAVQCKKRSSFYPSDAQRAISAILKNLDKTQRLDEIIIAVPANITQATRDAAREAAPEQQVTFWDRSFLDESVRRHHEIQARFFQLHPAARSEPETGLIVDDLGIESPLWESSKHYWRYALSKRGPGTVWVDRMQLQIIEGKRLDQLHAPREGAITQIHQDSVHLTTESDEYTLFSGSFFHYADNTPEVFRVELTSDEGYEYRLKIKISWHEFGNSISTETAETDERTVHFPIASDEGALRMLKQQRLANR